MSVFITPIFIPSKSKPPRCPGCNNVENKKTVCANCDHDYAEDGSAGAIGCLMVPVFLLGFVWAVVTFMMWAAPYEGKPTLVEVVVGQIRWVISLLGRIA